MECVERKEEGVEERGGRKGGREGERTDTDGSIPKATATGATLRLGSVRRTKVGGGLSC